MKKDGVRKFLENLSFAVQLPDSNSEPLEYRIFKRLVGTSRSSRLGPFPSNDVVEIIIENIRKNIQENKPIQIVSAWGGKKTLPGIKQEVDIAEYFTMLQYLSIFHEVQSIYPPGLQYNIFLGDAYYKYLYGDDSGVDIYRSRMRDLIETLDVSCFNLFSLEEFHERDTNFMDKCDFNRGLLYRYWKESEGVCEKDWDKLKSYENLCDYGWIGTIPSVMREYYLKRLDMLHPEFSVEEKIDSVVKFFAYGMMVSQNDLFGRKNPNTCSADFCLLRIPPPGMPKNLHGNRLRKRILPVKFSKTTAPPWAVAGMLTYEGASFRPVLVSHFEETLSFEREIVQVELFSRFDVEVELLS